MHAVGIMQAAGNCWLEQNDNTSLNADMAPRGYYLFWKLKKAIFQWVKAEAAI